MLCCLFNICIHAIVAARSDFRVDMLACYTVKYIKKYHNYSVRLFGLPSAGTAASRHRWRQQEQRARGGERKKGVEHARMDTCYDTCLCPKSRKKLVLDVFLVVDYDSKIAGVYITAVFLRNCDSHTFTGRR